jgi:hypothetical protein
MGGRPYGKPLLSSMHQTFTLGADQRLLFTYQPFSDPEALPAPGPVFIQREPCGR